MYLVFFWVRVHFIDSYRPQGTDQESPIYFFFKSQTSLQKLMFSVEFAYFCSKTCSQIFSSNWKFFISAHFEYHEPFSSYEQMDISDNYFFTAELNEFLHIIYDIPLM